MTTKLQSPSKVPLKPYFTPVQTGLLQRECACGTHTMSGECEECKSKKGMFQRASHSPRSRETEGEGAVPPIVHEVLRSPGQPLEPATRAFMEPRFGHDFSSVRVHTDAKAAESARAVNALAYTVGRDVVMQPGQHTLGSRSSQLLLAHELAHVVRQGNLKASMPEPIVVNPASDAAEHEAEDLARASVGGGGMPAATPRDLSLMRLTPAQFRAQLGATSDQKTAINALFSDAQFKSFLDYLSTCRATPRKDLGPLALKVSPGLGLTLGGGGVERFGEYGNRTLEINPTKPEHRANPQELVDTIVHELIHAVSDLEGPCVSAGAPASPLAGAGTATSVPALASVKGTPAEDRLLRELGPGASNPCEEFIDINKKAQQIIVAIIQRDIKKTKVGHETLTFANDALRSDPQALADYKSCRDAACAKPDPADRKVAIDNCSDMIILKYVTPLPPVPKGSAVAAATQDVSKGEQPAVRAV